MGKLKHRYNTKARQGTAEGSTTCKESDVAVGDILSPELKSQEYVKAAGNELVVIPNQETGGKIKSQGCKVTPSRKGKPVTPAKEKKLSKKQRKLLEKVVDQKKKKLERNELLEALSKVQVENEELAQYSSTSSIGQIQGKRKYEADSATDMVSHISSLKGKKRGRKERLRNKLLIQKDKSDADESKNKSDSDITSSDSETEDEAKFPTVENLKATRKAAEEEGRENIDGESNNSLQDEDSEKLEKSRILNEKISEDVEKSTSGDQKKKIVQPAVHVALERKPEIQESRLLLPILAEEQQIMEKIQEKPVTILCGETGSGKTTQVPQFLYEAGYSSSSLHPGLIGITEPRRVAAISMSKRVAEEMNLSTKIVSYQIRYEGNVTDETRIKFMTDGVLLKEIETDFLVSKYSVIIIDEAHERSVFTDILIGLLSRIVPLRNKRKQPLKLIIMSATLRIEDFTENKILFPNIPPTIKVDSRQFPVTTHFNKRTSVEYLDDAFKKACKIHRTLKSGGILIFVTGQNEVHSLCRRLRRAFPLKSSKQEATCNNKDNLDSLNKTKRTVVVKPKFPEFDLDRYSASPALDVYDHLEDDEESCGDQDMSDDDFLNEHEDNVIDEEPEASLYVLPLYSLLSSNKQAKVFDAAPEGTRLCVVATNVAETSLTIPGISYVIDTGRVKRKLYDKVTGVSSFRITWTSKASANQRAGRAGRVEPGHCYRLYSSAVFQNEFEDFSEPEIRRKPAEDLLLQMKGMGIDKVVNFPFPTPPDGEALRVGENLLRDLGALQKKKNKKGEMVAVVTDLGKILAKIPVAPRYSKMIYLASHKNVPQHMITIVAALTVRELFTDDIDIVNESQDLTKEALKKKKIMITQARRKWAGEGVSALLGDLMVILRAVGACEYSGCTEKFCKENGLRYKAMIEIRKLRAQLTNAVNTVIPGAEAFVDSKMKPPTPEQALSIRQIVLGSLSDRIARKLASEHNNDRNLKNAYQSCSLEEPVFIHPASSLFNKLPEFVVYQEIHETSKMYMKGITAIEPSWLPLCAPNKCKFSKPLEIPSPSFDDVTGNAKCHMTFTYGPHMWSLPAQELDHPLNLDNFRWFAKFLLEGKVLKKLEEYVPFLLTPPSVMVKSWSKLQPKTEVLLNALVNGNVYNRETLLAAMTNDSNFLLREYKDWIPESKHSTVAMRWPPLD